MMDVGMKYKFRVTCRWARMYVGISVLRYYRAATSARKNAASVEIGIPMKSTTGHVKQFADASSPLAVTFVRRLVTRDHVALANVPAIFDALIRDAAKDARKLARLAQKNVLVAVSIKVDATCLALSRAMYSHAIRDANWI